MDKRLIQTLKEFGLTEYEASAYIALNILGKGKASEISKKANIPQSKIYEVLESLARKELVEFIGGKPKEFKAIDFHLGLQTLLEKEERRIFELKKKIERLKNELKELKKEEIIEGVWTLKGKGLKQFIERLCDMFGRTSNYIYVITRDFTYTPKIGNAAKNAIKRGVEIKTIGMKEINEANYIGAKLFHEIGVKIRIFKTNVHPRIILSDGKEVLIRLDQKPTQKERFRFVSIHSYDKALVKVFETYLKNLWKIAKPVNFSVLDKHFGYLLQ